ncbi:Thioesterase/thiol ester dehydrase-isomerase [Rickenella mellea]|uniref:Thioesterase/thiol ester dehydrase-isomerase n=1 Tax=Rickenella mellea TaxID=50990 RepID=A0A4Y7QHL5_9AGAM|nr:Thioesterase/thiol ester dehydrase-isomerase [Rickenella mellea]
MPLRTPNLWSESLSTAKSPQISMSQSHNYPDGSQLQPRHMHDSYSQIDFPFASSPALLDQYMNAWGGIRTGKLLEHLDTLAGSIAYKHLLGPGVQTLGSVQERGYYIVTASVDRLDMLSTLYPVHDVRLSGHVIYVGKSSMEIAVKMEALEKDGSENTLMLGRFSMVCRDAKTHSARKVNPLIVSTAEEKALYQIAHKSRKILLRQRSLSRVPPSSEEAVALHNVYLGRTHASQKHVQDGSEPQADVERVWMGETRLEKCMLMFPQDRNVHQKIFGGYLMRLAYELGFANATMFTRSHQRFLSLDGISFARPVPIGSILRLTSHITHSAATAEFPVLVHVNVQANVVDVPTGTEQTTNDFRFTWCHDDGEPLRRMVTPNTYAEAMQWIEGRRALDMGAEIRALRKG